MDIRILVIQFRFYMGIVLVVISNEFSFQYESISRKIRNIILLAYFFFLFPNILICPSDIFFSTNVMFLGQVFRINVLRKASATLSILFTFEFSTKYFVQRHFP